MPMITAYKKAVISKTSADPAPSIIIKEDKKDEPTEVESAPPKAKAPPKAATPLSKGKFRSPYSLENILKEESSKGGIETELLGGADMPKTPFGQEQVDRFWKLYVQNHVDENNRSLFTTLNQRSPELKSHFKLIFPIENKVQLNQIDQIKVDLVNYLRKHLNNYSLSFETPIKKLSTKKHIYSDEEKYKAMVEKYPILEKLREGLDLDLDQ
jgi:DNA polymerase-3 subunit gamma/tau